MYNYFSTFNISYLFSRYGLTSVRPVLLKGYGTDGFKFYTNYRSRKAQDMDENPNVALTFYWEPLRRTVLTKEIIIFDN